jgi:sporadic carbohydrate cluster 2OG-Fe(II) oxygenase
MSFFHDDEESLSAQFLTRGYVIAPAEDRAALDRIRDFVAECTAAFLGLSLPDDRDAFLNGIAPYIGDSERLNALRLHVINAILDEPWFREAYFACGRGVIERIAGNELAMQRGIGFSIQLPDDESSTLPLHSDAWSEDSPFEVVLWIPFVDVAATKSMFVLPRERDGLWRERMREFAGGTVADFYDALHDDVEFLEIPYGNVLLFTHTIMHGNLVNKEPTTRWSMNVRFKSLFTPYSDKQLGDFFDPITLRAASRIGMQYRLPDGFDA